MDLGLITFLLIVGIILALVPVEGTIKQVIICILVIAVVISLMHGFGIVGGTRHWKL